MNYDSDFRSYDSVFHDKNVLFYATQIMIVRRRVTVLSYINVFSSGLGKSLYNRPNMCTLRSISQ